VVGYFRELFRGKLEREPSHAWDGLVSAVAELPAPELLEEVRQAYRDGLVDPSVADLPGIERDIAAPKPWRRARQRLITDAVAEMEWWDSFHPEDSQPKMRPGLGEPAPPFASNFSGYNPTLPYVREPKIGRNDACPCGSGKKYKKCCGKN
jgi:hypothetical protein